MNKLQTLENIAVQVGNMLSASYPGQQDPNQQALEVGGKSAKELKSELDSLTKKNEEDILYFKKKVQELEVLLDKPIDLSLTAVQDATRIISDIQRTKKSIESGKELNDVYRQRQIREAGFRNYDEILTQIDRLKSQRSSLREKFLGFWRFKKQIRDLSSKIDSLYDLFYTQYDSLKVPEIDYSEKRRFENAQGKLFGRFAKELFAQYRILLDEVLDREAITQRLNSVVLKSLSDDYISKYFKSRIEQELEANKNRDDLYGREAVAVLENSKLINEALAVLRDGLNQSEHSNWNDSDKDKERVKLLEDRVDALPYELQSIVREMIERNKNINKEFAKIGEYLTQHSIDIEKRRVLTSFSKVKEYVLNACELSCDGLPSSISITRLRWNLERIAEEIEQSLRSEKADYLKELDMEKWDVFRHNARVQQLYGREALESFNHLIMDEVFDRLLVTPGHTDASVNLGYKALWFKEPNAVVYNLLNFWRKPDYFLSVNMGSGNILSAQYVTSLTEEQLKKVEQLGIPGLMEIINTIKQYPNSFNQSKFIEGNEWIDNPVYEKVEELLGKVCCHYLRNGSDQEKYFVTGVAVKLEFMRPDKPSKQRDQLIEVFSESIGLDEHAQENFKKHYELFLRYLDDIVRRPNDLGNYLEELVSLSTYFDNLEELVMNCRTPERVKEEARSIEKDTKYMYVMMRDSSKLISYLHGFDSKIVETQLDDPEYGKIFKTRLSKVKEQIFNSHTNIEDVAEYVISDFTGLRDFIDVTNELAQRSSVGDVLKSEQIRILNSLVYNNDPIRKEEWMLEYFKALDDDKTARKFAGKDDQTKRNLESLARITYNCDKDLVAPLIQEAIRRDVEDKQLNKVKGYLSKIAKFSRFVSVCAGKRDNQKVLFDLVYELSWMGEDSLRLVSKIDNGDLDFNLVQDSIKRLDHSGIRPTSYLVERLLSAENRDKVIREWLSVMGSFADGNFDSTNELHRNLEYTRFRTIVDYEKVRRHIKNDFTFTDYLSIFNKEEETLESLMTEQDRFEIECVAEEAKVLRDYILSVKERADELGREVVVVPNLSYGYLPVSPIIDELEDQGVKFIIGAKVGSTECHNNKEVINSRLFNDLSKIISEQPIIIVVDGTKHLVTRYKEYKAARYPDAYQGYLNQIIAINDAIGFKEVDYSNAGKSTEDMVRLRQTPEFQRLVDLYKYVMKPEVKRERKAYHFGFWNTAGIDLIIRNYHQKIGHVTPTTPKEIKGPTMIFCNVGLLDEQIPKKLKDKYGLTHIPAYFDDSGKIINIEFGFDNFGVRYLNTLETAIKKTFNLKYRKLPNGDFVPSLIDMLPVFKIE